jgi:hypothetical protein
VLREPTLPLGAPAEWSSFWQFDALRGKSNVQAGVPAVATIQDMELAVATGDMVIGVPDGMPRTAPSPLVRYVRLRGADPSMIAVARRRGDRRREVDAFIQEAQRTAEGRSDLLVGGVSES